MSDNINLQASKQKRVLVEKVNFEPYGQYTITTGTSYTEPKITKVLYGKNVTQGHFYNANRYFDSFGTRKQAYTKMTTEEILAKFLNIQTNVKSNDAVKIYNKKKNKRRDF